MSRKANPTIIGAFVLGGIALAVIVIMELAGGKWFQERGQHILYFDEASQGLQVGAPVVFLGVRVGTVKNIQLSLNGENRQYLVRVTIDVEHQTVRTLEGEKFNLHHAERIGQLIKQGLRAQLKVQSLLTGQLYIDLNFHPGKPARFYAVDPGTSEIPTVPTTIAELTTMLQDFPVDEFLADLSTIADSINSILDPESVQNITRRLDDILANLESLTGALDQAADPLLEKMETNLNELTGTLDATRAAMAGVEQAAGKVGDVFAADSEIILNLTRAAEELTASARGLQDMTRQDSPSVYNLNQAMEEVSRAARALRQLAESLERQPEAILRGKR